MNYSNKNRIDSGKNHKVRNSGNRKAEIMFLFPLLSEFFKQNGNLFKDLNIKNPESNTKEADYVLHDNLSRSKRKTKNNYKPFCRYDLISEIIGKIIDGKHKEDVSIEKRNVSIEKRNVSIEKRNVSIGKRNVSIGKRNVSIGKRNVSIGKQDVSIGKRNVSIGKRNVSSGKRNLSIRRKNVSLNPGIGKVFKNKKGVKNGSSYTRNNLSQILNINHGIFIEDLSNYIKYSNKILIEVNNEDTAVNYYILKVIYRFILIRLFLQFLTNPARFADPYFLKITVKIFDGVIERYCGVPP